MKCDNTRVPWETRKNKEDYTLSMDFSVQDGQVGNPLLDGFWTALMPDLGKLLKTISYSKEECEV